jgi:hypothetical protein
MEKRGIASEMLPWLLIALVVLVISLVVTSILKSQGTSALDTIKNLFKGR